MELLEIIERKELQQMQDCFAQATGLGLVILDPEGNWVTEPSNFTDFCARYAQRGPGGGCQGCGAQQAGLYQCPAGLMNFYQPVSLGDHTVCILLGGQAASPNQQEEQLRQAALSLGAPEQEGMEALKRAPVRTEQQLRAAADLLTQALTDRLTLCRNSRGGDLQNEMLAREMGNMVGKTREIALKTQDLKKISTQQKLLSINAAIEAGRAGEAGKGFRIVADQMGKLAESSSEIYESITEDSNVIYAAVERMKEFRDRQ